MVDTAPQVHELTTNETRVVSVDFTNKLDNSSPLELLTGTPTVTQQSASSPQELTFSSIAVSSGALTINGETVITARAVQFTVTATTAGTYSVNILSNTTNSQVLEGQICLVVC